MDYLVVVWGLSSVVHKLSTCGTCRLSCSLSMWNLSSPARDQTCSHKVDTNLVSQGGLFTTGSPGKSQALFVLEFHKNMFKQMVSEWCIHINPSYLWMLPYIAKRNLSMTRNSLERHCTHSEEIQWRGGVGRRESHTQDDFEWAPAAHPNIWTRSISHRFLAVSFFSLQCHWNSSMLSSVLMLRNISPCVHNTTYLSSSLDVVLSKWLLSIKLHFGIINLHL